MLETGMIIYTKHICGVWFASYQSDMGNASGAQTEADAILRLIELNGLVRL
jgi:hypothetical protein